LQVAKEWGKVWYIIEYIICETVNNILEKKYELMDRSLKKIYITEVQKEKLSTGNVFCPLTLHETNISSSEEKLELSNKRLKYSSHDKTAK
jgi:hypothetical protein